MESQDQGKKYIHGDKSLEDDAPEYVSSAFHRGYLCKKPHSIMQRKATGFDFFDKPI